MAKATAPTIEQLYRDGYFSALDYHFAGTVGRLAGETDPRVLLAAASVSRETAQGHVCVELGSLAGKPVVARNGEAIPGCFWPRKTAWMKALKQSPLVAEQSISAPLVLDPGDRLYMARYWQYQQRLVFQLRRRAQGRVDGINEPLLARGLDRLFPPNVEIGGPDMQRQAAEKSVRHHLTVVSGGPGTGKTTTVVRILALIIEQALAAGARPPIIRLAAPTGKAAARLQESITTAKQSAGKTGALGRVPNLAAHIPEETATIHRLLGRMPASASRFRHDDRRLLIADVLVVDESSMVDLALMTRLLEAVPPDARLILLGDKDQLASVEAGAILGDICRGIGAYAGSESSAPDGIGPCIVHLTHSYRFRSDSGIGCLSRAINSGDADQAMACLKDPTTPAVTLVDVLSPEKLTEPLTRFVQTYYLPWIKENDPAKRLSGFNTCRILCGHRQGPGGVEWVNQLAAETLRLETGADTHREWYDGRPVMITRNDYQLGLFNGDMGVAFPSKADPTVCVAVFTDTDGAVRSFPTFHLPSHETVYAMTTHKSQGAEFDHVLLVLPPRRSPVITRELLYTAVTRARKSVTILGPGAVLREAVRTPVLRASGLSEQLWPPPHVDAPR